MTVYLWYSAEQERFLRRMGEEEKDRDAGMRAAFGRPKPIGFVIYLDDMGEPVKATEVTRTPDPPSAYADLRLAAVANEDRIMACNRGNLQPAAEDFCRDKDISPDLPALLRYIYEKETSVTYLRRNIAVGKSLHFKKHVPSG